VIAASSFVLELGRNDEARKLLDEHADELGNAYAATPDVQGLVCDRRRTTAASGRDPRSGQSEAHGPNNWPDTRHSLAFACAAVNTPPQTAR
jgi:hypothetical protein